jgi:hypothetical protein
MPRCRLSKVEQIQRSFGGQSSDLKQWGMGRIQDGGERSTQRSSTISPGADDRSQSVPTQHSCVFKGVRMRHYKWGLSELLRTCGVAVSASAAREEGFPCKAVDFLGSSGSPVLLHSTCWNWESNYFFSWEIRCVEVVLGLVLDWSC